jgi:hypothetical protein
LALRRERLEPLVQRLRRRWWVGLLLAIGIAFVGSVTVELLQIRDDLNVGRDQLAHLDLRRVDSQGGLAKVVAEAADHIDAADHRARTSLPLRALGAIPFVGSQVDTIRDLTGVAKTIADQGRIAADHIEAALDDGSGPESRIGLVRSVGAEIADLRDVVANITIDTHRWLVPPLNDARHELDRQLREATTSLGKGITLADSLEAFLTGPRRYLILGGNNAEMRAVGIPTTSGIASIAAGTVTVGAFSEATDRIELPEPGVPVDAGYDSMYGFLEANRAYRTALASPNWPYAAQVAADISKQNQYGNVDGIIYVDTYTLSQLMTVVGPVTVNGNTYYPFDLIVKLLHDNYLTLGGNTADRRSEQSDVAQAVFDALNHADYSLITLAGVLSEMAKGRHLLGWASNPDENLLWQSFGAGGELPEDGLSVVSEALNADKLDFFTTMHIDLETEHVDDRIDVTMDVTFNNPDHGEPTSDYIEGVDGIYGKASEYASYLVISVPSYAFDLANADYGFSHAGAEPPLQSAGIVWRIPEGQTRTTRITFSLPGDAFSLKIVPSARLVPTTWNYEGQEFDDAQPVELDLDHEKVVEDDDRITDINHAGNGDGGGGGGGTTPTGG